HFPGDRGSGLGAWDWFPETRLPSPESRHHHILRLLIIPKPHEYRLPQQAIRRDLLVAHVAHELRLDPGVVGTLGQRAVLGRLARWSFAHQRGKLRTDLIQLRATESRPRSAAVNQLAVFVGPDVQRAEAAARSLRLRVPDDDEDVDPIGANIQPLTVAAVAVGAVRLLGHAAFESEVHDL